LRELCNCQKTEMLFFFYFFLHFHQIRQNFGEINLKSVYKICNENFSAVILKQKIIIPKVTLHIENFFMKNVVLLWRRRGGGAMGTGWWPQPSFLRQVIASKCQEGTQNANCSVFWKPLCYNFFIFFEISTKIDRILVKLTWIQFLKYVMIKFQQLFRSKKQNFQKSFSI
jgi:hypothetical protein